jgi:hypothetical protein
MERKGIKKVFNFQSLGDINFASRKKNMSKEKTITQNIEKVRDAAAEIDDHRQTETKVIDTDNQKTEVAPSNIGMDNYRESVRIVIEAEVKGTIREEMQKATQEVIEEQRKVIRQILGEHKAAIMQVVEEEKKEIWEKAEKLRKSILQDSIH